MRAIRHRDFTLDFGHKHIYSRIPAIQRLYETILGVDLRKYTRRTGILYRGRIFEKQISFKGMRRGMPPGLLLSCFLDFLKSQLDYLGKPVNSLEDSVYSKRGRKFTRIFSQGFDERFSGYKWADLPVPRIDAAKGLPTQKRTNFIARFVNESKRSELEAHDWYHPAKGSGQIIDTLEARILEMGGRIQFGHQVVRIRHADSLIDSVDINAHGEQTTIKPEFVISSLPLEIMAKLMAIDFRPSAKEMSFRRSVVLVYLFLNREPWFPHTSLHVSCPTLRMGRVTNYGAFGGSMVPEGKGCLCIEYFPSDDGQLLSAGEQTLFELAIDECESAGLLSRADCTEYLVMKLPFADPAVSATDYVTDESRMKLFKTIEGFSNLFQINRTGTDKSAYAALMAAKAIVDKDRSEYVKKTRPDGLTMGTEG